MKIDNKEMVANFGALGYDATRMALILDASKDDVSEALTDGSEFQRLYDQGVAMADYAIDVKLFELAKGGDIKALDKLETRKKLRARR